MDTLVIGVSDTASLTAVEWVINRVRTRPADITLLSAFDGNVADRNDIDRDLQQIRDRILGASPSSVVRLGSTDASAADAIAEATRDAELLVIGSRHRDHLASLTGVAALRLAARSRCATVIVPEPWKPGRRGLILVGVDIDSSDRAVDFAIREAQETGAMVELVRAWTAPLPAYDPLIWIEDTAADLRVANQQQLGALVDRLDAAHPGLSITGLVHEGLASDVLADRAVHAELVVLGTHRHGLVTGFLLGSTARELLRASKTPVCIVPTARDERSRRPAATGQADAGAEGTGGEDTGNSARTRSQASTPPRSSAAM